MTTNLELLNQVAAEKHASPAMLDFLTHTMSAESGGSSSIKCKTSSAYGLFQILDGTWAGLARSHPGELTNRCDPRQQILGGLYYAQENAASLQAHGHEVTAGNLYLAHFLGAGGVNSVLSQSDSTRVSSIVSSAVMNSNKGVHLDYTDRNGLAHKKMFADFTVGDLKAWSTKKMGGRINYNTLDREVQDSVYSWQGDNEDPRNNFKAIGDMSFGDLLMGVIGMLLGGLLGGHSADQTSIQPPVATPPVAAASPTRAAPARTPVPARG